MLRSGNTTTQKYCQGPVFCKGHCCLSQKILLQGQLPVQSHTDTTLVMTLVGKGYRLKINNAQWYGSVGKRHLRQTRQRELHPTDLHGR